MRADDEGGRQFYSHLRDAYEALEAGNHPEAERSIMAAADIDASALAAVDWWNHVRAELALAATPAESDFSKVVTAFDTPTPVESSDEEQATAVSARWKMDWRAINWPKFDWRRSVFVQRLSVLRDAPALIHVAAVFGVCAMIASMMHLRFVRSQTPAPVPTVAVTQLAPMPIAPPAPARKLAAATANDAGPRWLSPRLERLGVLPRWRAAAIGLDDRRLLWELQQSVGELWVGRAGNDQHDAIILGVSDVSGLDQLSMLEPWLKAGGVLWVLHSVKDATITRQLIKDAARDANLTYRSSTRLTSTAIAEKLVRLRGPRART